MWDWLWWTIKSLIVIVALLGGFAVMMLMERKLLGWFQLRKGPNRVGPWGLFQPIADAVKMFTKEDLIPRDADRIVFVAAPVISLFVALGAFAAIPIAPGWAVVDMDAGMLVLLAITSLGVYGIALGGWASQSKWGLLGSLRSSAQAISYELSMGMSIISVFILAGSTRFQDIVGFQQAHGWNVIQSYGLGLIACLIFTISMLAETNRTPFDLPEAETELVAGYHTEFSGMRFAQFVMAEYIHMFTATALITLLFFGGWSGPWLPPAVWFLLKMGALLFLFVWIRATLPRLRYDRLMNFGWKVMLPASVAVLMATAALVVYTAA